MFREVSKMEQRYDAVLMVIKDGYSVSEVARKVKVSRQTLYKWLADYEASGLAGLDDRSHRPHQCPTSSTANARLPSLTCASRTRVGDRCAWRTS